MEIVHTHTHTHTMVHTAPECPVVRLDLEEEIRARCSRGQQLNAQITGAHFFLWLTHTHTHTHKHTHTHTHTHTHKASAAVYADRSN